MSKLNEKNHLELVRHSTAHILAQAVQFFFPEVKFGIGPVIKDGFYYDFDLSQTLNDSDLIKIENKMTEIISECQEFKQFELSKTEALTHCKAVNQNYKCELINDFDYERYSFFENGPFIDLCKGPHIEHTGQIKAFKLLRVSGAYWKGSESNKMLQRIYGTAFDSPKELRLYLKNLEEAKKRDHRLLGKQLNLFSIQEDIGGGLVLWHPKGTVIRNIMEDYWKKKHSASGYSLIVTPHIGKQSLWETSGHLDFYKDGMYDSIDVEHQTYFLKPMNCPFHIMIYNDTQHSYKQLPIRYAELGTVYRYERSGVLHGLFRVRGFTQDDAHIICTKDQVSSEIKTVLTFSLEMLKMFGFKNFKIYISTKPKDKYVGADLDWNMAEKALSTAVNDMDICVEIDEGGGAFYGPKIDIKIEDAIGREWQCSTIQFDFNLPERFNMFFINSKGEKERPFMIHRALLGSIERFFGILVEHYAGEFPFWLAPVQFFICTVHEGINSYAKTIQANLEASGFRVSVNLSSDKISQKIKMSINDKVPYILVLGNNEMSANTVNLRNKKSSIGEFSVASLIEYVKKNNEV